MKKRVLMSMVLLAIIGTSAVFAQQPTLDKLRFTTAIGNKSYIVNPKDKNISGDVVIPDTYDGLPVTYVSNFKDTKITSVTLPKNLTMIGQDGFKGCTGLKSVTIPENTALDLGSFSGCTNLTSVTFLGTKHFGLYNPDFPGDLRDKYRAASGGAGTYTRKAGSDTWTKQGGAELCPYCGQPLPPGFKKQ